jgi:hypothetical protein
MAEAVLDAEEKVATRHPPGRHHTVREIGGRAAGPLPAWQFSPITAMALIVLGVVK